MPSFIAALLHHGIGFVMHPPLDAGGIMFSGCPSGRPKPKIPPVHGSVGLSDQSWPFCGMSVRLSRPYGVVSGHLKENAWRQWPETLRADVSWLDYCYGLLILLIFVLFWLNETGQIWGFRTFHGEPNEEITWCIVYWCILITVRTD